MVLAEVDFDAQVLHLVAGDDAAIQPLLEALFDGRHEVAGNHAAHDRVDPQEVIAFVVVELFIEGNVHFVAVLLDIGAAGKRNMRMCTSPNWPRPPVCFLWR